MHILVINDDGPPSTHSSPYVHSLVRELQAAGHTVSVCLPHTQRSWIGKAHMIGQTLKPTYYRPPPASSPPAGLGPEDDIGTTHSKPSKADDVEEWVLVDGTPASCAQIGLHHFFQGRGAVDLVVSGPNYGRNTTAVFALSSGTLGGALEAAACGYRAVALSYAFFTRNHDPEIVGAASRHAVRVVEALARQWPADGSADVYSVNVPLVEGVEQRKTVWAGMLQNYWVKGNSAFEAVDAIDVDGEDEEEEKIREGANGEATKPRVDAGSHDAGGKKGHDHRHFKWAPKLADVMKAVDSAPADCDGRVIRDGHTSVTALKANFWHAAESLQGQELKLDEHEATSALPLRTAGTFGPNTAAKAEETQVAASSGEQILAIVDYEDAYVQPIILSALQTLIPPSRLRLLSPDPSHNLEEQVTKGAKVLQIRAYEAIDFDHASSNPATSLINSYVIRKALIRKHFLSTTVDHWVAKNPTSPLRDHVKASEPFEVDYAEFLDDALDETFDLRASLERNGGGGGAGGEEAEDGAVVEAKDREWWILKPSMSDRGQGIRLFSTMEELQAIFDGWEADAPDSDDEDEGDGAGADSHDDGDGITTSHLRHFVAQPYIHPPLLIPECGNRKFHIRAYVLCVGALKVYVGRSMLALFAGRAYSAPWEKSSSDGNEEEGYLDAHLTNTCIQGPKADAGSVRRFWDVPGLPGTAKDDIFTQVCAVTGEVFEAAAKAMMVHFQPLPFAFEVFGLDFLVDAGGRAWLLEVNAFPDFKQTGDELRDVVAEFWEGAVSKGVGPFVGVGSGSNGSGKEDGMVLVRDVDLGRR
ncbi:nucleotidase SurE [Diaporthe amygdali]|uniref:nucleotidase SurE n=1 Tax=Phomopsis amygdali TaxID=1214568 RepID=UPI0022FE26D4|nr:nucleotidase SurE [Diaporthe amygdali]KAJ0119438.1 nucleotidase SurE [Diaporthe amygdali]